MTRDELVAKWNLSKRVAEDIGAVIATEFFGLQQQLQTQEEANRRLRETMVEYLSAYDGIMRGGLAATERLSIALSALRQALEETDAD